MVPSARTICAALCLYAICAFSQSNLLPDSSFELSAKRDGGPREGWWIYSGRGQGSAVIDKTSAHTGKQSVRISGTPEARFVFLSPRFEVSSGDEISFSSWIGYQQTQATNRMHVGLMFRDREGRVIDRARVYPTQIKPGTWTQLQGAAIAPAHAISAEFQVNFSNFVGSAWVDDVNAGIKSQISLYLDNQPSPWTGDHQLTVRIRNRQSAPFRGTIRTEVAGKTTDVPVTVSGRAVQKFKIAIALPEPGAHHCAITLLDASCKQLRSVDDTFHIRTPLTVFPASPSFHNIGEGNGNTHIDARVNVDPKKRLGLQLAITVRDSDGNYIAKFTNDASHGEYVGATVQVPVSKAAGYDIAVHLLDRTGKQIASGDTDVHVHNRAESIVTVGPDGYLKVGGEPQFPIGLYSCGRYSEMADAAFTTTHSYSVSMGDAADPISSTDIDVKRDLDQNYKHHLRMMVELPRHAIEKAQWAQIRHRIESFRNHPGLLCWGSEERVARGEAPLANTIALYQLVHELDPNHPLVLGDTWDIIQHLQEDRRHFFPDEAMDVGIWWWYPIPVDGADGGALEGNEKTGKMMDPPAWLTTTLSKKPLWIAIQSYQKPKIDARFPTPAEYRCMAYLSIINGVRGLWFYTGSGQKDFYGRPAGIMNKPEEGHWDYVSKLVHELRDLSPVIMSPTVGGISLATANPAIEFKAHEHDGKIYLFAANKSAQPQNARFTSARFEGRQVGVVGENHSASVQGRDLADTFEPFGVHVYRIEYAVTSRRN